MTEEVKTVVPEVSPTKLICDVEIPANSSIDDNDIINFDKQASKMNRLEINHYLESFTRKKMMCNEYREIIYTSKDTIESFKDLAINVTQTNPDDAATKLRVNKCIDELEEMRENNELNEEDAKKDLAEYEDRLDIGIKILNKYLDRLKKEHPQYVLVDDITDTLSKSISSISSTDSLNKDFFVNGMNRVIEEINSAPNKILNPYSRMENKLQNPKRVKDIVNFVYKNPEKSKKECYSVAFTDEMLVQFLSFYITERNYRFFISDDAETEKGSNSQISAFKKRFNFKDDIEAYQFLCNVFFYHLTKIAKANTKRTNYLSLIFKCYVLQAIELESQTRPMEEFRNLPEVFEKRKSLDPNSDSGQISETRQILYENYDKIFSSYISSVT